MTDHQSALTKIGLFSSLAPDELQTLSDQLVEHAPKAGDTIVREGDEGSSLFIVSAGLLNVTPRAGAGDAPPLEPGAFFGEMALLTGEPRSATITATTDSRIYELKKDSLEPIMRNRPGLSQELARTMAERRQRDRIADAALEQELEQQIQAYFGLGRGGW